MPSNLLNLEIVAPTGIIFEGEVDSISLPTVTGQITLLPHHTALFTKLAEGEILIKTGSREQTVVVSGGFLEVEKNAAHILSDHAIRADSIEIAATEARKRAAEDKLKQKLDNEDFTMADKDLKMSILELKVANKIKHRTRPS